MLIEHINNAIRKAVYEKMEDGTFAGKTPPCAGVIAFGETLYQCQDERRTSLEAWKNL